MAFLRDRSIYCISNDTLDHDQRVTISVICIPTSTIGFTGAALQLRNLWPLRYKQRRRPSANPRIVLYLAISDMITCLGMFILGILFVVLEPPIKVGPTQYRPKDPTLYEAVGASVEIFALLGVLASVMWTFSFALDMCFQMYTIECHMAVYHILSWCIPVELVAVIEAVNFGFWPRDCEDFYGRHLRIAICYVPVMLVTFVNPVLFFITYKKVKKLSRCSGSFTVEDREALNICKWKLFWMMAAFTLCWFSNIISVIYDLITVKKYDTQMSKLDVLWYSEALLNPLQGILNYFVYRHSFKVSSNYSRPGQGDFQRVSNQVYGTLEGRRGAATNSCNNSRGQEESDSLLLNSGRTINPPKEPKYKYVARLLGEIQ